MGAVYGIVNGCGKWDGQWVWFMGWSVNGCGLSQEKLLNIKLLNIKLLNIKLLNIKAGKNQWGGFKLKFKPGGFFQTKLYQDQDGLYASILDAQFLEDGKALYRPPGWMVRHVQTTRLDGMYRPPGWILFKKPSLDVL